MQTVLDKKKSSVYKKEKLALEKLYRGYDLDNEPQTNVMRELIVRTFSPYLNGGIGLELGCSDGYMTKMLSSKLNELHVVDASEDFIRDAKRNADKNTKFKCSLFEEYNSKIRYDYVFATFILEHVMDAGEVLEVARKHLKKDGKLFVVVPNARALSRQLALHMGLLSELKDLTPNDLQYGHRRVYDRVHLNRDLEKSGFENIHQGGLMLKILADFQLNKLIGDGFLNSSHIDGLYKMGLEYPDLCGALFSICTVK